MVLKKKALNKARLSKKAFEMPAKKTQAAKPTKAVTLAKKAAAQSSSKNDNFGAGIAAGAGVGAVGVLAAYIALRACQRKKDDGDNFERLLE